MIGRAPFAFALIALIGCDSEGGGCDGVLVDLEQPVPSNRVFDGAAAVRVTGGGMNFINGKLPAIVDSFVAAECRANPTDPDEVPCPGGIWGTCEADGLCHSTDPDRAFIAIKIPPTTIEDAATCVGEVKICHFDHDDNDRNSDVNDCTVYVRVDDIDLTVTTSGDLDFTSTLQIWSNDIRVFIDSCIPFADFMCNINIQDDTQDGFVAVLKDVSGSMSFNSNNPLGRLTLDLDSLDAEFTEDDVQLCGLADVGFIKGIIFNLVGDQINETLDTAVRDTVRGLATESCLDTPCSRPDISTCNAEDICVFNNSTTPVPALLGLEGSVDLGGLLGGFGGESSSVDFTMFAASSDDKGSGLELAMTAGARAPGSSCVPNLARPNAAVPAFVPGNNAPGGGSYHAAIGTSDRLLNTLLYEAANSGALCQTISGATIPQLTSGALSLAMPSLVDLTGGRSVPLVIDVRPRLLPYFEIGQNILGPDPDDPARQILIEPLLNLVVNELDLDIFAAAGGDGALVRIATLTVDVLLDLSLSVNGTGSLQLVSGDSGNWLQNTRVSNMEVLREDPSEIEAVIPILLGQILPALTDSLLDIGFDIPPVIGFNIGLEAVAGSTPLGQTLKGDPRFAHMTIYSNLEFDPDASAQRRAPLHTLAYVRSMHVPTGEEIRAGDAVRLEIDVGATDLQDAEMAMIWHRVDGGLWRPPFPGRRLIVKDPVLHTEGMHTIEIAVARVDDPKSLDPLPLEIEIEIDALAPEVVLTPDGFSVVINAADTMTAPGELDVHVFVDGADVGVITLNDEGVSRIDVDSSLHEVRVEVMDGAGRLGVDVIGQRKINAPVVSALDAPVRAASSEGMRTGAITSATNTATVSASGCNQTTTTPSVFALMLLLLGVSLRRVSRRIRRTRQG